MPSLDGLRFASFLFVFMYHALLMVRELEPAHALTRSLRIFEIGWMGVDVFFVLSGFLITSGLLASIERTNGLWEFYKKRILRIFPLYYAACAIGFFLLPMLLHSDFRETHRDLLSRWPYYFAHIQNMCIDGPKAAYLAHFWSLAVEEQFYLVWPVFLLWMHRSRNLWWVCAALVTLVLCGRIGVVCWGTGFGAYLHFGSFARIDSLIMGGMLAISRRSLPESESTQPSLNLAFGSICVALGFAITFWPSSPFDHWATQSVGYTIIALGAVGLVALLSLPIADRTFLAHPVLVYLGRISYGLYVIHWPVLYFGRMIAKQSHLSGTVSAISFMAICFVITLMMAVASFHGYEQFFLRLKHRPLFTGRKLFKLSTKLKLQ
jgi:peptidoglycan/LPS O-acetylase OafA/YrhL